MLIKIHKKKYQDNLKHQMLMVEINIKYIIQYDIEIVFKHFESGEINLIQIYIIWWNKYVLNIEKASKYQYYLTSIFQLFISFIYN